MKALLLFIFLLSASSLLAIESVQDSLSAKAEAAYLAGDPAAALDLYGELERSGTSPALLFNIGNCHFKLGAHPQAILYYERALKLAPSDEDVRRNLTLARARLKDRVNELPGSTLLVQWDRIAGGHDPDHWARRSLLASAVLFALLSISLFTNAPRLTRSLRVLAAGVGVYLVLALPMAVARNVAIQDDSAAIIMAPKVDVRSEPRSSGTILFVIHKGTKVNVLRSADEWLEVELANGSIGWMPSSDLERI